ncbi:MAG: ribokinase [Opitutaceae bacterium]|nr:ribokinase [Opitutaceae bacterium]
MKTSAPIAVVGSANVDHVMQVPHLPARGETVTDGAYLLGFGGKGANQAVAVGRLSGACTFIGAVGKDAAGAALLEGMRESCVDTRLTRIDPATHTGTALVMVDQQGANYLTVAPGANYSVTPVQVDAAAELLGASPCILLQMEVPVETNERVLALGKLREVPVILNYAPVRLLRPSILRDTAVLVVNENEAEALVSFAVVEEKSAREAAMRLAALGPSRGVITRGPAGATYWDREYVGAVPAYPVKPVDTTAAGDTFCGGLAVALSEGKSMHDAVVFASAAAALSVTRMGAQSSIPWRREVDEFLAREKTPGVSDPS